MNGHGFLEVETPMMHPIPGGASAKPFVTHHNALDMQQFLRIAPELYLKRLVVGGFEKVFEINRNFRNEGLSPRHNPEFTMMEFYEAYADYKSLMDFTEGLLRHAAREALDREVFEYQGRELDLSRPFHRMTMVEAVRHFCPQYSDAQLKDASYLRDQLAARKVEMKGTPGLGTLQLMFFEETAEALLWEPTFIIDYPVEVSPLARASDSNPEITERFELFIVGPRNRQRILRAQRRRRPGRPLRGTGQGQGSWRRGGDVLRCRLHPRPRIRPAADRRLRHRHRPPDHAADRLAGDPRRHPFPADASRVSGGG
jgi:lysyl-tRNA synthetase class 2